MTRLPAFFLLLVCCQASADEVTEAQLKAHAAALKAKPPVAIPGRALTVAVEYPFVVVGDQSPKRVRYRAHGTVRRCVKRLRAMYFARVPDKVITIWVMADRASYLRASKALVGREPTTPYGFYDRGRAVMVMNISTGGGTLVHELVHPFVEANVPGCPTWFNEGLASLYEHSDYDGATRLVGLTNWRLRGLHKALAAKDCPTIAQVCAKSRADFYGKRRGLNYAVARYTLFYLQDQNLLVPYYKAFLAARKTDPTGYQTLLAVLRDDGIEPKTFQQTWEAYVRELPPYRRPAR